MRRCKGQDAEQILWISCLHTYLAFVWLQTHGLRIQALFYSKRLFFFKLVFGTCMHMLGNWSDTGAKSGQSEH